MRTITTVLALTLFSASAIAATTPPGHPQIPTGGQAAAGKALPNKGKVISTIDASMYTYIEVSRGKDTVWIAVTSMQVKKGDTIAYDEGAVMTNFYSKTLNRTFPQVIFVSRAAVVN